MSSLERAISIAATAHSGQLEKAGAPYILHPLRVMLGVRDPIAKIVAVLHDVVEDTALTLGDLEAEGFAPDVLEAVALLTHDKSLDYEAYLRRVAMHPIARTVKLADLRDNLDATRLPEITPRDAERMAKYRAAVAYLESTERAV